MYVYICIYIKLFFGVYIWYTGDGSFGLLIQWGHFLFLPDRVCIKHEHDFGK